MGDSEPISSEEKLYRIALDTRNFEISLYWQRSNYFLVLNSALAVGFFSDKADGYKLALAILGSITSVLWIWVNLGGKYWQSRWEQEVAIRERKLYPDDPLFQATPKQTDEYVRESLKWNNPGTLRRWLDKAVLWKPSVSMAMMVLSAAFLTCWIWVSFPIHGITVEPKRDSTNSSEINSAMSFWHLFETNSGPIQSIAALFSIALTVVTIFVLFVTWRAIKRQATAAEEQADAARALTQVAKDQTVAAFEAAKFAQRQSELLSSQIEQNTAPLLVAELDEELASVAYNLVNIGPGVAFQIFFWVGTLDMKNQGQQYSIQFIEPSTLGPGNRARLPMPPRWEVITVRYKGLDREERWTIIYNDPLRPQEHVVKKGLQEFYLS